MFEREVFQQFSLLMFGGFFLYYINNFVDLKLPISLEKKGFLSFPCQFLHCLAHSRVSGRLLEVGACRRITGESQQAHPTFME